MGIRYDPETGDYIDTADDAGGGDLGSKWWNKGKTPSAWTRLPPNDMGVDPNTLPGASSASGADAFRDAWLASGGRTVTDLEAFVAAHPEFGATIFGSKNSKIRFADGRAFQAVRSAGINGGIGAAWDDITNGEPGAQEFGGAGVDESYLAPFDKEFQASAGAQLPEWQQPADFSYADFAAPAAFQAPTAESILSDPSYQFRLDQTNGALENSAAARGVLNSGGTLWDLMKNSSAFASQEYGNIWNRDKQAYDTDVQNQFNTYATNRGNAADIYDRNYGLVKDTFNARKGNATDTYSRDWTQFLNDKDTWYTNQNNAFDKLFRLSQLGYNASA